MQPENFRFGGGASETILHPIVLVAMLIAIALIFLLSRKYVIWPVFCTAFLIPFGQELLIGGLHFFVFRIVILTVAVRMLVSMFSSPEGIFGDRLGVLDVVFVLWTLFRAFAGVLVFSFNSGAMVYQAGFLLDAMGGYFVLRYLIRDEDDIYRTLRAFVAIACVVAVCMIFEKIHQVNVFGLLGGVRADPEIRNGTVRSQGPFQHELLAGTFGATLLPLFFLLWKSGKSHVLAILGAVSATIMVFTSHSSTPVLAYGAGLLAICAWPLRRHMRVIRWGAVIVLVSLHLVMKAPVWFLIQRVDVVGGSSGYHRARLVNDFIMHFRDWWLVGTTENARWGFNMWDMCNQFVAEGQVGGLVTFASFVALICICFSRIGAARSAVAGDSSKEWFFWLFGSALFSHVVGFFGISYFDQTRFAWFALLAMIATATALHVLARKTAPRPVRPGFRRPLPAYAPSAWRSKGILPLKQQPQFKSRLT
ncbi:MAG TPA: hypothetical protein VN943_19140 [Candidatus Acidoferrum sp.]|nr:hypothetical protein [Candidatus Acidoferrum sp.]